MTEESIAAGPLRESLGERTWLIWTRPGQLTARWWRAAERRWASCSTRWRPAARPCPPALPGWPASAWPSGAEWVSSPGAWDSPSIS
jgi:hypothetical protein